MSELTIQISDEQRRLLEARAREAGVSPEEYARQGIVFWVEQPGSEELDRAAEHLLNKNRELYRRLA